MCIVPDPGLIQSSPVWLNLHLLVHVDDRRCVHCRCWAAISHTDISDIDVNGCTYTCYRVSFDYD